MNASVATVDERSIDEGVEQYTSTTRVLQDCLEKYGACMKIAKGKALLDVWFGRISATLSLDGAYNGRLWTTRFGAR